MLNKAMPEVYRDSALVVKKETVSVLLLIIKKKWVMGSFRCSVIPSIGELIMIDWRSTESRDTIDICRWNCYSEEMGGFVVSESTEAGAKCAIAYSWIRLAAFVQRMRPDANGATSTASAAIPFTMAAFIVRRRACRRAGVPAEAVLEGGVRQTFTGMFYTMGRIIYGVVALENPSIFNNVIGVVQDTANVLDRNYIDVSIIMKSRHNRHQDSLTADKILFRQIETTVSFDEDYDGCHWTLISVDEYLKKGVSEIELAVEYIGCTDEHGCILVWSDQLEFVVDNERLFEDRGSFVKIELLFPV
ncbi:unnamed protein product [Haemonchus placei]|uniref:Archease domain-containing protein n=1 Tax=Haemonchus placei TaxID=6290 RepID=A0A158QLS2_HAEPC|nr:unnamed protein product [Haemonchus placei]